MMKILLPKGVSVYLNGALGVEVGTEIYIKNVGDENIELSCGPKPHTGKGSYYSESPDCSHANDDIGKTGFSAVSPLEDGAVVVEELSKWLLR